MLAHEAVAPQHDERRVAVALIKPQDRRGALLPAAALPPQRTWRRQDPAQRADSRLIAKKNQPGLWADIAWLFAAPTPPWIEARGATTIDQGHGRMEVRRRRASPALADAFADQGTELAPGLQIERSITRAGTRPHALASGLTRLPAQAAGPDDLLACGRAHWQLEHRVHWRRDVTLRQDSSRLRHGRAPQLLVTLNNAAMTLMDRLGAANVPATMREFNARPAAALSLLFAAR